MNSLTINRQNGNVPKSLPGKDHVSGFIFYVNSADIPATFVQEHIQPVSTIEKAEALGILADGKNETRQWDISQFEPTLATNSPLRSPAANVAARSWALAVIHYQLSETFRLNPGITLYVGIFAKPETHTFAEIAQVQNYADGAIRQIAIWDGMTALTAENVHLLQAKANALDLESAAPVSIGYAPSVKTGHSSLPINIANADPRVSVIIAQAGGTDDTGAKLFAETGNKTTKNAVSCIGVWLGHLSSAAVHESISWVKKFPSGITLPALSDGTLVRSLDKAAVERLDTARYMFLTPIVGVAGSYWNDSHNMDSALSDYNAIELVRTMDKACRGIRTYLTPELGGNVYIDPSTGKLQSYAVAHLETTANQALEDMEKAGELSGYEAKVDPEQDVLKDSTIEVVIRNVPVGVMRKIKVKIGYVKSL